MKKIIKNLLVGFIPFLPFEKVSSETITVEKTNGTLNMPSAVMSDEEKAGLKKILRTDFVELKKSTTRQEIEDLMRSLDDLEREEKQGTPSVEVVSTKGAEKITPLNLVMPAPIMESTSTNILTTKAETAAPISDSFSQNTSVTTNETVLSSLAVSSVVTNVSEEGQVAVNDETKTIFTKTNEIVASSMVESEKIPSQPQEKPFEDTGWFPMLVTLGIGGVFSGVLLLSEIIDKKDEKKRSYPEEDDDDYEEYEGYEKTKSEGKDNTAAFVQNVNNEEALSPESNEQQKSTRVESQDMPKVSLQILKPKLIIVQDEEEAHRKGIRKLTKIKARRAEINRQMKELRLEKERYPETDPEYFQVIAEMDKLSEERGQLSREAREARILIKGKMGEVISNQRRLLAKQMRLAKRAADVDRIEEITQEDLKLKKQEKQMIKAAEEEIKKRAEQAGWWHGKRLYTEALEQEKELKKRIEDSQTENGLSRSDVLKTDQGLASDLKEVQQKKRLALRLMKGRQFTNKRRLLSKRIIEMNKAGDSISEAYLMRELEDLKRQEKEHMKRVKTSDYKEERFDEVSKRFNERQLEKERKKLQEARRKLEEEKKQLEAQKRQFLRRVQRKKNSAAEKC